MALFIIDGVPGSGKTLNTIKEVKERAEKEGRRVFYNYITDLSDALGWVELSDDELKTWHEDLPDGSILVVDEAWRHFAKWNSAKKEPPPHVLAFFQHRKRGHDVYLIVQSARVQLDPIVYENTEAHIHFQRVAGSTLVKRFEWNGSVGNPKASSSIASARCSFIKLDKSIFKLYKSAEIHTHKFRPPLKFILAGVLLFVCLIAIIYNSYRANQQINGRDAAGLVSSTVGANVQAVPAPVQQPQQQPKQEGATVDLSLERYKPRLNGMPWTAPVYDHLRQPQSFPRLAACMLNVDTDRCSCYTQQATLLPVPDLLCRQVVKKGFFDETLPDRHLPSSDLQPVAKS